MPRSRVIQNIVIVTAFTILCVGGIGYLAIGMGLHVPLLPGYKVSASFASCEGLVPQSDVAVAGVKVGAVDAISSDAKGNAVVTMRINPDVKLRSDTRAVCRPKSLLGEKYVELVRNRGSKAPYLKDGAQLPLSQTGQSVEIDSILNTMDAPTRTAFSTVLRELGVALDGRAVDVNSSIPQAAAAAANLRPLAQIADRRQQQIDQILKDLAIIMAALADEQDALGHLIDDGNATFGAIAVRDTDLAGTIQQLDKLFTSLDVTFADLTPADRASLDKSPSTIASGSRLLGELNPEVDRLLPELLLAQINYPNNQLNVTHPQAFSLAREWMSAFAQRDSASNLFRFTNINDSNGVKPPLPPGVLPGGSGANGSPSAPSAPPAGGPPPAAGDNSFAGMLQILLHQQPGGPPGAP